jgi:hypothetical protein
MSSFELAGWSEPDCWNVDMDLKNKKAPIKINTFSEGLGLGRLFYY